MSDILRPVANGAVGPEAKYVRTSSHLRDDPRLQGRPQVCGGDRRCDMSMSEREKLSAVLFGDSGRELVNIRFFKGNSPTLTADDLCATARGALEKFWSVDHRQHQSKFPTNGRVQREARDILAGY